MATQSQKDDLVVKRAKPALGLLRCFAALGGSGATRVGRGREKEEEDWPQEAQKTQKKRALTEARRGEGRGLQEWDTEAERGRQPDFLAFQIFSIL